MHKSKLRMQKQRLQTYPSKPIGLYAAMEWGLKNVKFVSPFSFCGSKEGKELTFQVSWQDHAEDFSLLIPEFNEQYLIMYIPNKKGDNAVLLTREDCLSSMGSRVNMKWIAERIKTKWIMTTSPTSTSTQ